MDLEELLNIMDRAAANLAKLGEVWKRAATYMPTTHSSQASTPEYDDLSRAWDDLLSGLPPIEDWKITSRLPDVDDLGHSMFEAFEAGVPSRWIVDEAERPGRELSEYRYRLNRVRRRAIRDRLQQLLALIDTLLPQMLRDVPRDSQEQLAGPAVEQITSAVAEIERLVGDAAQRLGRWSDLYRHMRFSQGHDWHDIAEFDWPSVRTDIEAAAFADTDPLPVPDIDLGHAAAGQLTGQATSSLAWDKLLPEGFERLLFDLLRHIPEYQNVQWLSHTNAPDRSRDLSVDRVLNDSTGNSRNERVIVQAKHWLKKSVNVPAVSEALANMKLWEPPVVRGLIIATSGRFSSDAVQWIEDHNERGDRPYIEMWPENRLEVLLARNPSLAVAHGLR